MAANTFYTQVQLEKAKATLENLPDLTPDRLTRADILESLKEQILTLYTQKGYSAADIKSALDAAGIKVGLKAIQEAIAKSSSGKKNASRMKKVKAHATPVQSGEKREMENNPAGHTPR